MIRTVRALALAAVACLAPGFAARAADIVDTAAGAPRFETLVSAVQAADLVGTLKGDGPFTVFAPTDEAFDALGDTVDELLKPENKERLAAVLRRHVVPGKIMSSDLSDGMTATTVAGDALAIGVGDGPTVEDANIVTPDLEASNGVIHTIDKVLVPAGAL